MQKRTDNFSKFANQKKGSAVKEAFRQEKKKIKQDARAAGEEMRQRKKDKMRGLVTEPLKKSTKPGARKSAPTDRDERAPRAGRPGPLQRPRGRHGHGRALCHRRPGHVCGRVEKVRARQPNRRAHAQHGQRSAGARVPHHPHGHPHGLCDSTYS